VISIDDLIQKLCDSGARAVRRYAEVSGDSHWKMLEFFMPALVFNELGDGITATLETSFADLSAWNADSRKRRGLPQQPHDPRLLLLAQQLAGRRVDMILFEGEEDNKPKDQQDFLVMAEFKRGWLDSGRLPGQVSDRDKLLMLLDSIDMCPWGLVCGWIQENHREWQMDTDMKGTSDRWFESMIQFPDDPTPYWFCARLFARGSDDVRVRDLLQTVPPIPQTP
jgi:hypothetical protein